MRLIQIALIVVVGISSEATARPRPGGGSGGGGGRLSQVSAGIAGAVGNGGGGGQATGARASAVACPYDQYRRRVYDGLCVRRCPEGEVYRWSDGLCGRRTVALVVAPGPTVEADAENTPPPPQGIANVSGYVVAQKVIESDGALALELAFADRWLRLEGTLTQFYERQANGETLTLTIPSLAIGVRIDDSKTTRVYLEAGAVGAVTKHDPMMDSSITGALGGVHVEHSLSKRTTLIGAAKLMAFEADVRAASVRAGVRYRYVQASFSVLDFNVGPALYGPEIGVGF